MDNESVFGNDFNHYSTAALTQQDRAILDNVESALANGLQIKKWWEQTEATHSYADRFETVNTFNRPDRSFAFFDQALLNGQPQPVMGDVIELFYDGPKAPTEPAASAWMRDQIREFILHYFMRVSDFRRPQAYVSPTHPAPPPWLRPLSWCPEAYPAQQGFGYEQYYYKLRDSGQVGKFPEAERFAIVDVRELEQKYEWIVLRVRIFDFNLTFRPLGQELPQIVIPLREHQWVVMSRDFILNEDHPEPGVLGAYGYGYAVFTNPADQESTGIRAGVIRYWLHIFQLSRARQRRDMCATSVRRQSADTHPQSFLQSCHLELYPGGPGVVRPVLSSLRSAAGAVRATAWHGVWTRPGVQYH